MEEGDPFTLGADARFVVDELQSGLAAPLERRVEIVDRKADVVNSGSPFRDEASDRGIRIVRLQELHQGLAGRETDDPRAIGVVERNLGQFQYFAEKRHGRCEGLHSDSNVRYAGAARG